MSARIATRIRRFNQTSRRISATRNFAARAGRYHAFANPRPAGRLVSAPGYTNRLNERACHCESLCDEVIQLDRHGALRAPRDDHDPEATDDWYQPKLRSPREPGFE